jgi:MoxR-like ATPase
MSNLILPPEVTTSDWDTGKRDATTGFGIPVKGMAASPIRITGKATNSQPQGGATNKKAPVKAAPPKRSWNYVPQASIKVSVSDPVLLSEIPQLTEPELSSYVIRPEVDQQIQHAIDMCVKGSRSHWPYLLGPAGTGKDTAFRWHAAQMGMPYHVQSFDQNSTMQDILGRLDLKSGDSGGTDSSFIEGRWLKGIQTQGFVINSEINFAGPGKLAKLQSALSERRLYVDEAGKTYYVSDECIMGLNANPSRQGYHGTQPINPALKDRCKIIRVPAWTKEELEKIPSLKSSSEFDKLADLYTRVQDAVADQGLKGVISIRGLLRLAEDLKTGLPINECVHSSILEHFKEEGDKHYQSVVAFAKHNWPEVVEGKK